MGVQDNAAAPRLPEDPRQAYHREHAGIDDIPQHVPRAHGGKLIHVAYQNQLHSGRDRLEQGVHQDDVDHGTLVHNEHVPLQPVFLVALIALRGLELQQAVDGSGFHACCLGHPLCGAACGSRQQDTLAPGTEHRDHAQGRSGLAGARTARQHHYFGNRGLQNGVLLDLIVLKPGLFRKPLKVCAGFGWESVRISRQPFQLCRHADLGVVKGRQINGLAVLLQILCAQHRFQGGGDGFSFHFQQFLGLSEQLLLLGVHMPLVRQRIQGVKNPAAAAERVVFGKAQLFRQSVRCFKAHAPDIVRQPEGVLFDHLNAFVAVNLIDLRREGRADAMALEKEHDVLDFLLLFPAVPDHLNPLFSNAGNQQQPVCFLFDHRQGIRAECPDDPSGEFGPHAPDQSAAQVFLNAVDGGRHGFFPFLRTELIPVLGIHLPVPLKQQNRTHVYVQQVAHHRHQLLVVPDGGAKHGIAVFRVLIGDPFHHTAQRDHGRLPRSCRIPLYYNVSRLFPQVKSFRQQFFFAGTRQALLSSGTIYNFTLGLFRLQ